MTVQKLIESAMMACGHLGFERTSGPAALAGGLITLNRLIDNMNTQRTFVMGLDTVTVSVVSGTRSYALVARPAHIERAELLVTSGGLSVPVPLRVCGVEEFAAIPNQGDITPNPKAIWCDYGATTATVFIAPTPAAGSLKLYTWAVISQFSALSETVTLLPGVLRALTHNLALELAPMLNRPVTAELKLVASDAIGGMEKLNLSHAVDAKQAAYPPPKAVA